MKHFYRGHDVQVNSTPQGTILFDIYNRSRQHLITGFSLTDPNEQTVMERMRARVDQIIAEPPTKFVER